MASLLATALGIAALTVSSAPSLLAAFCRGPCQASTDWSNCRTRNEACFAG